MKSNKKRLISILIGSSLLIMAFLVIFICFSGGHFEDFGDTVIIMMFVSLAMMIVPISAWLINNKHLARKEGLRICTVNSAVIFVLTIIWPIMTIIKNEPCSPSNSMCEVQLSWEILGIALFLTVLYCLINICFLVDLRRAKR